MKLLLAGLLILSASPLLEGCKEGGAGGASAQADAPPARPMTPASNAAAVNRYAHEPDTPSASTPP